MKLGRDKYQLELRWDTVEYEKEGLAIVRGAYFTGPALKISQQLNEQDEIKIDMTKQYFIFVPSFYIAKVKWNGIEYKDDRIYLKEVIIENKYVNSIPKLKDTDYFLIDTAKHEEETHAFHPNYDCYLLDELGELYKF
jgi:hypothetical protein